MNKLVDEKMFGPINSDYPAEGVFAKYEIHTVQVYAVTYAVDKVLEDGTQKTMIFTSFSELRLDEFLENQPINHRRLTGEERDRLGV